MTDILFKEESYSIIGACMKVHAELGAGFLEAVYQEALKKEFMKRKIPFECQKKLSIFFDGQKLDKYYIADFLCYDSIIVELKVYSYNLDSQYKQLRNYLKAIDKKLGILVNFGTPSLTYKRLINPSCNSL